MTSAPIYREDRSCTDPIQIIIAINDKCCPRCGARYYWPRGVHFDLGSKHGKYFGAVCFNCGWSFGGLRQHGLSSTKANK